jgi:hypothetical protein
VPLADFFRFQRCSKPALQYPIGRARTHGHHIGVQHHEGQPTVSFLRVAAVKSDDRLLLPRFQPGIPRDTPVMLICLTVTALPGVYVLDGNSSQDRNRRAGISVLRDQFFTKSTNVSRTSWATQQPFKSPQDFYVLHMLLYQFGEHFVLPLQFLFEFLDPEFLLAVAAVRRTGKSLGASLKKFRLPAVKDRRLQSQFVTKIRDWNLVHKMPFQNPDLFFRGKNSSLSFHQSSLRLSSLTQTAENSNSR